MDIIFLKLRPGQGHSEPKTVQTLCDPNVEKCCKTGACLIFMDADHKQFLNKMYKNFQNFLRVLLLYLTKT